MARKKVILVKDILEVMEDSDYVMINFYAYGLPYATSIDCGPTVKEVKENINFDCKNAKVTGVKHLKTCVGINAEIVY